MRWVSDRFWSSYFHAVYGAETWPPRRLSCWGSGSRASSVSPFTCPQLPPYSLWWRGAALALALLYATTSMLAEHQYSFAWSVSRDFQHAATYLELANRLFPLEYRIRNAPAYLYVALEPTQVARNLAIERVRLSLQDNPYAADLHTNLLKLYAEEGNQAGVKHELEIITRLAPSSALVKQIQAMERTNGVARDRR